MRTYTGSIKSDYQEAFRIYRSLEHYTFTQNVDEQSIKYAQLSALRSKLCVLNQDAVSRAFDSYWQRGREGIALK